MNLGSWQCVLEAPAAAADWSRLYRFEVHEGAVVVDDRGVFLQPCARQIALCIQQLERRRKTRGDALLFRVEADLGELARLSGRFDPLKARAHLTPGIAYRRSDLQFELLQAGHLLLALEPGRCDVGVRRTRADRVIDLQLHAPGLEVVAEDVAKRVHEAALCLAFDRRRESLAELELRATDA